MTMATAVRPLRALCAVGALCVLCVLCGENWGLVFGARVLSLDG